MDKRVTLPPPAVGYSVNEVARSIGISEFRARTLIREGVIPSRVIGRRRRVSEADLTAFQEERLRRADEARKNAPTDWDWEGNVVANLVEFLESQGWAIVARADPATREHGVDLKAQRDNLQHWIEVKGWPSRLHTRGPKQGQPKRFRSTIGRSYAGDLLLSCLLLRADHPDDLVSIAVPAYETFTTLIKRLRKPLERAEIGAYVVYEDRHVEELIAPPRPSGGLRP